jgi:sugar fermentation stimulation protein A
VQFSSPLLRGRLVQRYKRFFADVDLDLTESGGGIVTAHCPNPGAMLGLNTPGLTAWVSRPPDPKRKLQYTLELVEADGGVVGINTLHPNRVAAEAIAEGRIAELAGYPTLRREVKYAGDSRIDILLEDPARPPCWVEVKNDKGNNTPKPRAWVEVKNCHFSRVSGLAEFPDCKAARSAKHMRALAGQVRQGDRGVVLWIVQRSDCDAFDVARDIDPAFDAALSEAVAQGVEVLVYTCDLSLEGITVSRRIPWRRA